MSVVKAQEKDEKKKDKENLLVKLQEGAKPKIIVDGKVFDFPLELIDQTKVASMMVVKKQEALKKYDAPNGVIIIITKEANIFNFPKIKKNKYHKLGSKNGPKIILDGKVTDKETLDKLSPSIIKSMKILKDEIALKKYNAPNGVIIITTKN